MCAGDVHSTTLLPFPLSGADRECWQGDIAGRVEMIVGGSRIGARFRHLPGGLANAALSCRGRGAMGRRREAAGCSLPKSAIPVGG